MSSRDAASGTGSRDRSQGGSAPVKIVKKLGPGLITGAADDDPSGIATYSQVGAQFGNGLLWTMLLAYPLMVAIQEISARIGRVTGHGIAGNIRRHYPRWLLFPVVGMLIVANVINIGADIAALGTAVKLMIGGPALVYSIILALFIVTVQLFVSFEKYVDIMKWLTLVLFAYVGTAVVVKVNWSEVLFSTIVPAISLNSKYLTSAIAVFGTTISPYLFFWQASLEVDQIRDDPAQEPLKKAPRQAKKQIRRIQADTYIGMAFSNIIAWFIIVAAAATLHSVGKTDIQSAEQAAEALRPIAGDLAFLLFSIGIIGTGLLGIPALAGATAYGVGEAFHRKTGLERSPFDARLFYAVIAGSVLVGLLLNFAGVDPIKALFWSAVINGVVSVPVMVVIMLMAGNSKVMGTFPVSRYLKIAGWFATAVMFAASAGMLLTWGQ